MINRSPTGCVERTHHVAGQSATPAPPVERTNIMLSRTPHASADLSRRSRAQRRLRRAAAYRLFCSTNGCATFLEPDISGRRAVCPVCGLERTSWTGDWLPIGIGR